MNKPQRSYLPTFANMPQTWDGRWSRIREFVRRWHGLELGDVGKISSWVQREEDELDRKLPPSFREWIAFNEELSAQDSGILRDGYAVELMEDYPAITLQLQSEGDLYWAVTVADLINDDPPVGIYFLNCDDETSFIFDRTISNSISDFALTHMASFLHGAGGGLLVRVNKSDTFLTNMRKFFPVESRIEETLIFEKENLIAFVHDFEDGPHLRVEVSKPIPREDIPKFIWKHTTQGGTFHGMFAEKSGRLK